ncbi:MAG: dihydroneopterin aldolase [Verrucomicrobia bacterium]|jgi:D-erythro-7,8-dihydroneopterin triphosphate epimerase|nr:dihydroneopterin aldolase [Verrucomicrobiota bacterium]
MADKIYIRDLKVQCIVGINPHEREEQQEICINISMDCDYAKACLSDQIEDTVNYKSLKDELVAFIGASSYLLIEKLAEEIASRCLSRERVSRVVVCVDKPGALTGARSVAVEIERSRA